MKYKFTLEPRDLLFLRDARPMEASDAGLGANWPRPDQLWNAVLHAFHRAWPERQDWEGLEHTKILSAYKREGSKSLKDNPLSSDRFGALKTFGPFPFDQTKNEIYFPAPLDLDMKLISLSCSSGDEAPLPREYCPTTLTPTSLVPTSLVPAGLRPCGDLPAPLTHAFSALSPDKKEPRHWLSAAEYDAYLTGGAIDGNKNEPRLYDVERNIGIGIDPETHSTVDGKLYQAEYLRLKPDVTLAFDASCDIHPKGTPQGTTVDVFEKLGLPHDIIIGGQQGVATLRTREVPLSLPKSPKITTQYLRWTLLSPAIFNNGWIPDWIAEDGQVMLPNAVRTSDMSRATWKTLSSQASGFKTARLVAARIGKPLAFSGWDLQTGPKPTLLAVPAGSCYVFDCGTPEEASALAVVLAPERPRSSYYGEKGYGIGLCSSLPS